jgi:hypothetical protein
MSEPSTTVVISTRNRLGQLREAVASALAQGGKVREVVVVDDASDDGTWDWLASLSDPRVRAVRHENHSEEIPASARMARTKNRGLKEVRTEFVVFLDDDDHLLPGAVDALLAALERQPRAALAIGGRIVFSDEGARRRARNFPHFPLTREILPDLLSGWGAGVGQWLAPTELLRKVGAWRELPAAEEWEVVVRLSVCGPATLIPTAVMEERMHPGQWGWEPPERTSVMREVRGSFSSPGSPKGVRDVVRANHHIEAAIAAYDAGRYGEALKAFSHAVRIAPSLLRSPLSGPYLGKRIFRSCVGVVVGPSGAGVLKRTAAAFRRTLNREPEGAGGWK